MPVKNYTRTHVGNIPKTEVVSNPIGIQRQAYKVAGNDYRKAYNAQVGVYAALAVFALGIFYIALSSLMF